MESWSPNKYSHCSSLAARMSIVVMDDLMTRLHLHRGAY